jgi:uncharacterized protein DUF1629
MNYFYRFCNVDDFGGESDFVWKGSYRPSDKDGLLPIEWTKAMEEIPQNPPWPHCKVLRAPLFPAGYEQQYHMFKLRPGAAIPDIFCTAERALVSERAKAVLEACDDFGHEYIETEIQDVNHQRINQEPYYLLSVRRFLRIDELGGEVQNWKKLFFPNAYEKDFLPTLQKVPELMEKVAQLPLWRHRLNFSVIYMSERVLATLREAGLTGLKDYSHLSGEPGESITRFEA